MSSSPCPTNCPRWSSQNKRLDLRSALSRQCLRRMLEMARRSRSTWEPRSDSSACSTPGDRNSRIHPHVHCVVPAGGFDPDDSRLDLRPRIPSFCPSRAKPRLPRQVPLKSLATSATAQHASGLETPAFRRGTLLQQDWIVYAKPPFGGADRVLRYLGRYTHRVAISSQRLLTFDGPVSFRWRDYAHGNKHTHHDSRC